MPSQPTRRGPADAAGSPRGGLGAPGGGLVRGRGLCGGGSERPVSARVVAAVSPWWSLLSQLTPALKKFFDAEREALAAGDLEAAVEANVQAWVVGTGRDEADADASVVAAVRTMQRRAFEIADVWGGDVDEVELDPPALDRLDAVTVPVHLLVGAHDLDATHVAANDLLAGLADVRQTVWPDVAHLPAMEQPERFVHLLQDWLARCV